ncbi:MAG: type II secretion system protein GspL [Povalibacter sp.]
MTEALVIRLKAAAENAHAPSSSNALLNADWLLVDATGARQGSVRSGTLNEAAVDAAGRKVILLVPGTDVYLAEPVLPVKSGAKLLQMVPFALEEQMATDIDDMHFGVGRREGRPGTPVAAVSHKRMQSWHDAVRDAGIHVEAVYADSSALPVTANGVTLLIEDSKIYVKREAAPPAVLEVQPLIEALQLALAAGDEAREHVTLYLDDDAYERDRDLFEGLREFTASLQVKLLPDGALPLLAATAMQGGLINLLQGKYAVKTRLRVSFEPWRYVAALALFFVLLHLGLKFWQFTNLKRTEARLDSEIAEVFQQAMPGAPVPAPLSARRQMEARLAGLRGNGPVSGVLVTLGALGEALGQAPGTDMEALSYRDNATDVRVLAPSVDALDKIQHTATQRGLTAEIQSATPRGSKVEGRMKFKRNGV